MSIRVFRSIAEYIENGFLENHWFSIRPAENRDTQTDNDFNGISGTTIAKCNPKNKN